MALRPYYYHPCISYLTLRCLSSLWRSKIRSVGLLCRSPPACGSMKYLHEKIQKDSCCKVRINRDLYSNDRCLPLHWFCSKALYLLVCLQGWLKLYCVIFLLQHPRGSAGAAGFRGGSQACGVPASCCDGRRDKWLEAGGIRRTEHVPIPSCSAVLCNDAESGTLVLAELLCCVVRGVTNMAAVPLV